MPTPSARQQPSKPSHTGRADKGPSERTMHLDRKFYPHLFDLIFDAADDRTLLLFRATCCDLRMLADARLCARHLVWSAEGLHTRASRYDARPGRTDSERSPLDASALELLIRPVPPRSSDEVRNDPPTSAETPAHPEANVSGTVLRPLLCAPDSDGCISRIHVLDASRAYTSSTSVGRLRHPRSTTSRRRSVCSEFGAHPTTAVQGYPTRAVRHSCDLSRHGADSQFLFARIAPIAPSPPCEEGQTQLAPPSPHPAPHPAPHPVPHPAPRVVIHLGLHGTALHLFDDIGALISRPNTELVLILGSIDGLPPMIYAETLQRALFIVGVYGTLTRTTESARHIATKVTFVNFNPRQPRRHMRSIVHYMEQCPWLHHRVLETPADVVRAHLAYLGRNPRPDEVSEVSFLEMNVYEAEVGREQFVLETGL